MYFSVGASKSRDKRKVFWLMFSKISLILYVVLVLLGEMIQLDCINIFQTGCSQPLVLNNSGWHGYLKYVQSKDNPKAFREMLCSKVL